MRPEMIFPSLLGLLVLAGLAWWFAQSHSHMWRLVATRYARKLKSRALATRVPETIVVTKRGAHGGFYTGNLAYRQYAGASIAIHEDGLSLSLVPPFNIMCPRLFLPFDEMELKQTDWALWPEPFALRMRQLPELDIIVGRDTVRWIREHVETSPFGLGG